MGIFKDCGCGCNGRKQEEKLITSIISGLTFFVVANPETFRLMRSVFGARIATPTGCPSTMGLLLHTVVFILVVWGMMNIRQEPVANKKKGSCGCGGKKGEKPKSSFAEEKNALDLQTRKLVGTLVNDPNLSFVKSAQARTAALAL